MSVNSKTHTSRIRVRYAETDAMGWVYYACYLHYFEVARSDLIRSLWKSYRSIEEEDDLRLPVIEAKCRYVSGARYEDELDIDTVLLLEGIKLRFQYEVRDATSDALIAEGSTVHCFVDSKGRPKRPPDSFKQFYQS